MKNQKTLINTFMFASLLLVFMIFISFCFLASPVTFADESAVDVVSVTVPSSCSLEGSGMDSHNATMEPGSINSSIGETTLKAYCNDMSGFAIYAIGFTGEVDGQNWLASTTLNPEFRINTGIANTGDSEWAMKISVPLEPTPSYPASIENGFDDFHIVPDDYTLVAKRLGGTDVGSLAEGSTIKTTYQVYVSPIQPADTYVGKVKYKMVCPSVAPAPEKPLLYNFVASQVKTFGGEPQTQSTSDLKATITEPTSSDPSTDTSNSGVFLYNASAFGVPSDADSSYNVYYYRGVLDSDLDGTTNTYGSNGNSEYYQNYVLLDINNDGADSTDTCWRIVRTTGSGGVKMIYNGLYGATNSGSCANATTATRVGNIVYGIRGASTKPTTWDQNVNRIGYTFNNDSSIQDVTSQMSVDIVFGGNSNYSTTNTTDSNVKNNIENTWYPSKMTGFTGILEQNAGYCGDRVAYSGTTVKETIAPFRANSITFGSYIRNARSDGEVHLSCPESRNVVDLYTASSTQGNGQLSQPVALLTGDEAALAGSGSGSSYSSNNHNNSYLYSGSAYWLLSPAMTTTTGFVSEMIVGSNGRVATRNVYDSADIRPVVSVVHNTMVVSGSGTATSPWIIEAP